ncbi:hypothetical protein J1614_001681 [Plenodomus biglobosus]|nr:hypothetical protein J1614_001681 [Plenodomus biglobosus]
MSVSNEMAWTTDPHMCRKRGAAPYRKRANRETGVSNVSHDGGWAANNMLGDGHTIHNIHRLPTRKGKNAMTHHPDHVTMSCETHKLLHELPSDSESESEPQFRSERKASPRLSPPPSSSSSRTASASPALPGSRPGGQIKRQSSFAQPRPDGAPRTPNRVRFEEPRRSMNATGGDDWVELDGDDYMDGHDGRESIQRLPLLTGIQAPSITVAEQAFDPADHLESARPRSGMRSAFMNMANSIM